MSKPDTQHNTQTLLESAPERVAPVLRVLEELYPVMEQHLQAKSPWQLLVATVLAAQCTDARVNLVTPELFERWPDAAALAGASPEALEEVIRSTGFFRMKAKNLLRTAAIVAGEYNNSLPADMQALIRLPGVARKTANCVLHGGFGINDGVAVDTHVKRIAFRLGLTGHTDPVEVEKDLMALFPQESWGSLNNRMVSFGRHICTAKSPRCRECPLDTTCPSLGVFTKSSLCS